ncbi:MAG: PAS domain S-box protein [Chitinophagaceae bacterium]|nr:PAS domain S-box protein [Chitinophagaceae bacterium]
MKSILPNKPLQILVVEDNPGDFLLLKECIELSTLPLSEIHLAETLAEAIEILTTSKPDVVFLDLYLPDSNGLSSFHRLQANMEHSAVIILSGLSDTKTAQEAIAGGAQDFLSKGDFDEKLLAKTILYSIERKRSLVSIREANKRYELVSKATNDLIWDLDLETGLVYRDESAVQNILGFSSNSAIEHIEAWNERIHPDDLDRVLTTMQDIKHQGKKDSFELEYRFLAASGTYKFICDKGYIVRNAVGKPIRIIGAAQDITPRKNVEAAMVRQQALFRVLIERSPDMKTLISLDGIILYATPAITSILGYSENEYMGVNEKKIVHPEDIALLTQEMELTIKDPAYIGRLQLRLRHKEGYYKWCDKIITNLLNDPHVGAIVCNLWDITKEKQAEELIRASEEKYRQIFYDNPFPMFLYDIESLKIIECNNATLDKYQYSREEFLQLSILDLCHSGEQKVNPQVCPSEGDAPERLWHHSKKSGEEMAVEIFIYTIEYAGKKVRQAQINDITEKLKLGAELDAARHLQQLAITEATIEGQEKERGQLGIELHDNINQILATAKLYLDYAVSAPRLKKDMIIKGKKCVVLATEEIRKLSHSLLPPSLEEFGLLTALEELIHPIADTGKLFIDKQWNGFSEESMQKGQKLTIYRIVQEQLNNIIKHAGAKVVTICLRLMDDGEGVELRVKDDGIGFDPVQKKTGVGLRNIVSRAGLFNGKVKIVSSPGEGCELVVVFTGILASTPSFNRLCITHN